MKSVGKVYCHLTEKLDRLLSVISASLIGITALTMFVQVISRYTLKLNVVFIEELSTVFILYAVFLIAPTMLRRSEHISIDLFDLENRVSIQKVQAVIVHMLCIVASIFLTVSAVIGTKFHIDMESISVTEIAYPIWLKYLPFLIGSCLLLLYSIELAIKSATSLFSTSEKKVENHG